MTNDPSDDPDPTLFRVFVSDINGKISMEGYLFGSIVAHDPYLLEEIEELDCTFEELNSEYFDRNPVVGGLIGQAIGDAFGVPFEFLSREEVRALGPQDMVGSDCELHFSSRWNDIIPSGAWSDDTSMAVAAMSSIVNNRGRIDFDDVMDQFLAWWDEGKYSSLAFPFGLGGTVGRAFDRRRQGAPALICGGTGIRDNGNGALMRMFPFSIYCILNDFDDGDTLSLVRQAAKLTHGHEITAMSCYMYTLFLRECIRTRNPMLAYGLVFGKFWRPKYGQLFSDNTVKAHSLLLDNDFSRSFNPDCIPESGYVVDSLAVSVYSVLSTECYEDAIKTAVSLGYDTDTNAAIAGSIAGAMYGMDQVPERWLSNLRKRDELIALGKQFDSVMTL